MENPYPQPNPGSPWAPPRPAPVPRMGGTAVPGGVHLSSGNYGTAPAWRLTATGVVIMLLGALSLGLTWMVLWGLGQLTGWPLAAALDGLAEPGGARLFPVVLIGMNLLTFLIFLTVLHFSPLSGYHGAEHKVVHCLEHYGVLDWDLARHSPRAHPRCGTTLLAGLLPLPLVALPLVGTSLWPLALLVVVVAWAARYPLGAALQQIFTTREPTDHQLATALQAAALLLYRWRRDPQRRVTLWGALWVRGYPQMVAGVLVAMQVLNFLSLYLPRWLDWG